MLLVDKLFCFLASEKSNMRDSFFCLDLNRRSDFFSREMSRFCLRLSSRLNRFLSSLLDKNPPPGTTPLSFFVFGVNEKTMVAFLPSRQQ